MPSIRRRSRRSQRPSVGTGNDGNTVALGDGGKEKEDAGPSSTPATESQAVETTSADLMRPGNSLATAAVDGAIDPTTASSAPRISTHFAPSGDASAETAATPAASEAPTNISRTPSIFKNKTPKRSPSVSGRSPHVPAGASSAPTPILTNMAPLPPPADQPEFAELLTPAQLRRRKRPARESRLATVGGLPVLAGASDLGYTTGDGDLYRGAAADPTAIAQDAVDGADDEGMTISSASSGSSSWSWGSGLEHGRRATMAVVHRFGEAIGVRRGSISSSDNGDTDSTSSSSSSDSSHDAMSRIGRFGRALTRTMSRATNESSPERPRRVYVPRKREFTIYTPPPQERHSQDLQSSSFASLSSLPANMRVFPGVGPEGTMDPRTSDRVVVTPVLSSVLEAIRAARIAAGVVQVQPEPAAPTRRAHHHGKSKLSGLPDVPMRKGSSAPGRKREFALPTVPRPMVPRTTSRIEALKAAGSLPVRPKSASDLLGLTTKSMSSSMSSDESGGIPTNATVTPGPSPPLPPTPAPSVRPRPIPAWWLDVSCPSWKDLRDIGELLGLHPLTLEDVLHQDPREKLDMYDKLGYYFIVVRALDEQYFKYTPGSTGPPGADIVIPSASGPSVNSNGTDAAATGAAHSDPATYHAKRKERTRRGWGFGRATGKSASKVGEKVEIVEDNPGKEGLEGVGVGGVNLYLVVFQDGIVSFHYDDVSKHISRVLERVVTSTGDEATSDFICHGLLDSVIDAFFPLMGYVDGAVDDLDSLTTDPQTDPRVAPLSPASVRTTSPSDTPYEHEEKVDAELDEKGAIDVHLDDVTEKNQISHGLTSLSLRRRSTKAKLATPKPKASFSHKLRREHSIISLGHNGITEHLARWTVIFVYLRLFFLPVTTAREPPHQTVGGKDVFDRSTMLKSITDMRRLVTGLSRLLGGKHAVVVSLLKRASESATPNDAEAYLSDVNDHILLLQTSLYHYEYILSHCQPAYLSYLHVSSAQSRGGTDILILALSAVTMGILPMQLVTGLFSMNVWAPRNGDEDHLNAQGEPAGLGWFAGIAVGCFFIACGIVLLIRYWRWLARKRWTKLRGGELPTFWKGFWGWE